MPKRMRDAGENFPDAAIFKNFKKSKSSKLVRQNPKNYKSNWCGLTGIRYDQCDFEYLYEQISDNYRRVKVKFLLFIR